MRSRVLLLIAAGIVVLSIILFLLPHKTKSSIPGSTVTVSQPVAEASDVSPKEITYEVKPGDSLWSIAHKFGVSVEKIVQINKIDPNKKLQIGEKLRIPLEGKLSQKKEEPAQNKPQKGIVYQVKEGDTLWTIARKFGVRVEDIARVNGISINKTLQIGEKLSIPSASQKQIAHHNSSISKTRVGVLYQVRNGDSLWTIAKKYGISVESLAKANNISPNKTLQIGEKLLIPGAKVVSSNKEATLKVHRDGVFLRKGPGTNYAAIAKLSKGTVLVSLGQQGDWQKVSLSNGKVGWIRRDMLGLSLAKKSTTSIARRPKRSSNESVVAYSASEGNEHIGSNNVVSTAMRYRGTRYSYGGLSSRGFDCSGFVKYVYQKHGLNLPHNAAAQYKYGKPVSKSELQPGDLVFFRTGGSKGINHVGIYIGNGQFIHASSAKGRVRIDNLNSGYYSQRFVGARRLK